MPPDQAVEQLHVGSVHERFQIHAGPVASSPGELAGFVEHVGNAAGHAGGEVAPGAAEHHHYAPGHVLAAVVADGLDHRGGAGVADGEALAGHAVEPGLASGGAVKDHVADQDVLLGREGGALGRVDDQPPAGEALAGVIVGVAFQRQRDALGEEGAEALPGRAGEVEADGVLGQALGAVAAGDFAAQHGADGAMDVANLQAGLDRRLVLQRLAGAGDQLVIEGPVEAVVLGDEAAAADAARHGGAVENGRVIQAARLPVVDGGAHAEPIHAADHFVHAAEAHLSHQLARLFGDEEEVADKVLGLALELAAQGRVLGGDADRAGVEVALAHHHAAQRDQRRGGEAELLGAEQGGDDHVAAGLHLAVHLEADTAAQIVQHQHLLGLGEAELPGRAGVLDGAERRGAGAAVVAADQDEVGVGLGHAGGHDADAGFGDQLHRDARPRVDVLQVVDELGEVLDGVDVVVRRRRDQLHAGDGVAHAGDDLVHLAAGELAALAGLGALGDLDLKLVGVDQVVGGDAEAARGHLLDGAAAPVAEALLVFAALAGVGAAAEAVHGDGEGLVRLLADGAERHGAGREALDDLGGRLDLLQRQGPRGRGDFHQPAQGGELLVLSVDQRGVLAVGFLTRIAHGVLELADGEGIEQVILAARAVLEAAAGGQLGVGVGEGLEGVSMLRLGLSREHLQVHALDARWRAGEILLDQRAAEADGLEDLGAAIALERGDAHLGEDLEQALADGLRVVAERFVKAELRGE